MSHPHPVWREVRAGFISGLLLLAPLAVTVWVITLLVNILGQPTRELFFFFLPEPWLANPWFAGLLSLISAFLVLAAITLLGWFSRLVIGRLVVDAFDRWLTQLPLIKVIYNTVKQIIETFSQQNKAIFQRTVLIQYPRRGMFALGFVTSEAEGEVQRRTEATVLNVFMPTTPNPTSGFLLMVPKDEVIDLEMSVADAMKAIISGGAVVPPDPRREAPAGETAAPPAA